MKQPPDVITIDGPAGVGKSTLALLLADALNIPALDTGAMFRALALTTGKKGLTLSASELAQIPLHFQLSGAGARSALTLNGQTLGPEIRAPEIGELASKLATRPEIRSILLTAQREIGARQALVTEGRDMGSAVFPGARHKFFLDASPEIRAERRWKQLRERGQNFDINRLADEIRERDKRDRERAESPLKAAPDALIIDTSSLDIPAVLQTMLTRINAV